MNSTAIVFASLCQAGQRKDIVSRSEGSSVLFDSVIYLIFVKIIASIPTTSGVPRYTV